MSFTAGTVVDEARDRHSAFDKLHHPAKGAVRYLSRYVRRLHGKITQLDSSVLVTSFDTTLPLVTFDAGISLDPNTLSIEDVTGTFLNATALGLDAVPIAILDYHQRNAWNAPWRACWQQGNTLFLRSPADLWTQYAKVTVYSVVMPGELADETTAVALPDAAKEACIEAVALWFAKREKQERKDSAIDPSEFVQAAAGAEADYLARITNNLAGRQFFTQDVRPYGGFS